MAAGHSGFTDLLLCSGKVLEELLQAATEQQQQLQQQLHSGIAPTALSGIPLQKIDPLRMFSIRPPARSRPSLVPIPVPLADGVSEHSSEPSQQVDALTLASTHAATAAFKRRASSPGELVRGRPNLRAIHGTTSMPDIPPVKSDRQAVPPPPPPPLQSAGSASAAIAASVAAASLSSIAAVATEPGAGLGGDKDIGAAGRTAVAVPALSLGAAAERLLQPTGRTVSFQAQTARERGEVYQCCSPIYFVCFAYCNMFARVSIREETD